MTLLETRPTAGDTAALDTSAPGVVTGPQVSIPATFEATFVACDPARESWFALWDPQAVGGLLAPNETLEALGLEIHSVSLRRPGKRGTVATDVSVGRLDLAAAIDIFGGLAASADVTHSVRAWAHVVRFALDTVARARVLPWVSPDGWDTWRVDPLDVDDLAMVDSLAAALPAEAYSLTSASGSGRIVDPQYSVRACMDAVADQLVRSAARNVETSTPIFRDAGRLRVRHLSPWVNDLSSFHCAASSLLLRVHPPADAGKANEATLPAEGESTSKRPESIEVDPDAQLWSVVLELRSQQDPSLVVAAGELADCPHEVRSRLGERVEIDLLIGLKAAIEVCDVLLPLFEQTQPSALSLTDDELDELLDCADALSAVGVDLHWPASLSTPTLRRQVVLGSEFGPQSAVQSSLGIDNLLDVDWEFLLNGIALNAAELELLSEAKRSVVSLRGRWVRVDSSMRKWLQAKPPKVTLAAGIAAALGSPLGVAGNEEADVAVRLDGELAGLVERLQKFDRTAQLVEPTGLKATLRPYQRQGLAWLRELVDSGLGACLADDMGLGKTIQILALHESLKSDPASTPKATSADATVLSTPVVDTPVVETTAGPTLVICPTSLMNNWQREAAKFLPDTRVHRFHGPKRKLTDIGSGDIVVTTYGVARTDHETLAKIDWHLVVADEAQNAKNPQSRTAKALRKIPARSRIALTGTPVENHLSEMWSIIDWAMPGLFGNIERFRRVLAVPIERDGDPKAIRQLRQLLEPFLLRRRKTDPGVAPDLPPKTELDVIVPLTAEQITLYRAAVEEALAEVAQAKGIKRHGRILSLLTSLKQIANHPAQYLGELRPLANRSGKLAEAERIIDVSMDNKESTLVFTQYVTMGRLLVDHFSSRGVRSELLHGGLTVEQRQALVDRFQAAEIDVLILSLKAGGTGLNLTKASCVVHYDRWWNPAVEDQATDRAYRIGQQKPVTVHRLIAEGTVEDRVAELLKNKRQLSDRVLNATASWLSGLDDNDLAALVTLDERTEAP